jgi:hypothetical protein
MVNRPTLYLPSSAGGVNLRCLQTQTHALLLHRVIQVLCNLEDS